MITPMQRIEILIQTSNGITSAIHFVFPDSMMTFYGDDARQVEKQVGDVINNARMKQYEQKGKEQQ